jgi:hypothetical protein
MAIQYIEGPFISREIDLKVGLEKVVSIESLKGGMSGGRVLKIFSDNRPPLVLKDNPDRMHRTQREIEAYRLLKGTPVEPYLTMPHHVFPDRGVMVLPFFDGIQLRQGLQSGIIAQDTSIGVLNEVIDLKKRWWASQRKQSAENYLSMQQEEWPETVTLIDQAISKVASKFGISSASIMERPFEINGIKHPALTETVEETEDFLTKDPPYTIITHGDASGANILVNTSTKKWALTDLEWAWWTDPAQSYVRLTKQESTTTATHAQVTDIVFDGRHVEFTLNSGYHPLTSEMQRIGLESVGTMQEALGDPDFTQRYIKFWIGSHLREAGLAPKRKDEHMTVLAIHNTSRRHLLYGAA